MKVTISYKHLESTAGIDDITHRKSEKLTKYFDGKIHLKWNFTVEKQTHVAHCHLLGNHLEYFAEATTDSIYSAIDEVIGKLEKQIRKKKEIVKDHKSVA
jgi:putative sigma-54 modulation protein